MSDAEHPESWVALPPAEIVVSVDVAAVPEIPFASLRALLIPVRDPDGTLIDWELSADVLADPALLTEYRQWRARWRAQWPVGPTSNISALVRTAEEIDHHIAGPLAEMLMVLADAEGDEFDWRLDDDGSTIEVLSELEALRIALIETVEAGPGAGIVDDTPSPRRQPGLSRAWVSDDMEHVLAATASTAVIVRPGEGLVLLHHGPSFESFSWVTEVNMLDDPVQIFDDHGERLELSADQARPLAWLVPRALRWHVRTIPLVTVWTSFFIGLPEAVAAADRTDGALRFSTTLPLH